MDTSALTSVSHSRATASPASVSDTRFTCPAGAGDAATHPRATRRQTTAYPCAYSRSEGLGGTPRTASTCLVRTGSPARNKNASTFRYWGERYIFIFYLTEKARR